MACRWEWQHGTADGGNIYSWNVAVGRQEVTRSSSNVGGKEDGGMRAAVHCDGFAGWAAVLALPSHSTTCLQGCTVVLLSTIVVLPDVFQQQGKVAVGIHMTSICGAGSHMGSTCGHQLPHAQRWWPWQGGNFPSTQKVGTQQLPKQPYPSL